VKGKQPPVGYSKSSFLIFSQHKPDFTDHLTIYVAKFIFAGKNYFCHPIFFMEKKPFSTNRQKPAKPDNMKLETSGQRITSQHM